MKNPHLATVLTFLFAAIVAGAFSTTALGDDWPQWRHDAARSGESPDELPGKLHLQWVRTLPRPRPAWPASQPSLRFDVSYSPVVAGKMLFVPSMVTDTVTAYDTETGEERWRFYTDGPIRLAPIVDDGKVYAASDDGYLYCLSADGGKLVWRFHAAPTDRKLLGNERLISTWPIRGGPVLHEGNIYLSAGIWPFMGIFIHGVDAKTGKAVWTNSGEGAKFQTNPHSAPAFGGIVPRGHLAVTDAGLVTPGGRSPPGTFELNTGKLVGFKFSQKGGRSSFKPKSIKAGSRTFTPGANQITSSDGWSADVDSDVWSLLAADNRLFAVTTSGRIYCFGAIETAGPQKYPANNSTLPSPDQQADSSPNIPPTSADFAVLIGLSSEEVEFSQPWKHRWIVIDSDRKKIDALRRRMTDAGVYGVWISAHVGNARDFALPPHFASRIIVPNLETAGAATDTQFVKKMFRSLRPYGGEGHLQIDPETLKTLAADGKLANARIQPGTNGLARLIYEGALPGAADWTHQYADASKSVVSKDERAKAPLGLLWFGNGPPNDEVLPRHGHGPSPQVAHGRLFIEGVDMIRAIDIYTGRLLWQRDLPGLGQFYNYTRHRPGANQIGSNYVSLADSVYVVHGKKILRLDAATGKTLKEFTLPVDADGNPTNWGYVGVWENLLVATVLPPFSSHSATGKQLVVMDRVGGKLLWAKTAKYSFRHNNIAVGAGKIFCIDGSSKAKEEAIKRRGPIDNNYRPRLLGIDIRTGEEIWSAEENVFGTFLNYSVEHDVLLQAGSHNRDRARDESRQGVVAYQGADGKVLWQNLELDQLGPCMLHGDSIIMQGPAISLLTGKPKMRIHPLTGTSSRWNYSRSYGCNTAIASRHLITFRSGAAGYFDLANDGGTGNFGGFKSSCTSNLIIAGGLVNAPEYTRTCVCNYQNQTSLALVHDPDVETWTYNRIAWDGKPVRRLGVNFGAPGDRRADNDTLWLDAPSVGGDSPDVPVEILPETTEFVLKHSLLIDANPDAGQLRWVAASGAVGIREATLTLAEQADAPRTYTVRLHFAEPENIRPGQRVFDVSIQGKPALENFDVVSQTGGRCRAVVKEFTDVKVVDKLTIGLTPKTDAPPILCGIEVVLETK